MTMMEAVRSVFSKYATFTGRATRSEFWWWVLFVILISIVVGILDGIIISPLLGYGTFNGPNLLSGLLGLALILPELAVGARRLHDIGRSGWWLLLGLLPIIGGLVLLYWYVQPSEPGTNRFG